MPKTNDRRIICVQRMPFPSCRAWTVVLVGVLHSHTIRAPYRISRPSQGPVIFFFFLKLSCLTQYNNVILNFCPLFESYSYNQIHLLNCYIQNKYGYNIGCPPASFLTVYCSLMLSQFYIRNSTHMIQGWGYSAVLTTWKKRSKWRCYSEFSGELFSYENIYFEFVNILTVLLRHGLSYSLTPVG